MGEASLLRTPLHDRNSALGAKIVPFAGFEMPVQYSGILREHDAVRSSAGLFDLSHMGQIELRGNVGAWADTLTVNDVASMAPGVARYNLFCNDSGGTLDDVIFYRLADRWYLVVNASNADKMVTYLQAHLPAGIVLTNYHGRRALIAVQGPRALEILAPMFGADIGALRYYGVCEAQVRGAQAIVARTGYTGEDGFEIFLDAADAVPTWDAILERGEASGLLPAGLGARDVLRLEAGMPLYGHELSESISPLAAGLQWAIKWNKPHFVGKEALLEERQSDAYRRIVGLIVASRAPAREGYAVFAGDRNVGQVRSGAPAPSVGNQNIATALVEKDASAVGERLQVEIRGSRFDAQSVTMPFYRRKK